ncbi:hypothetical protein B0H19DRAFT_1056993 [Mycena capillaripes]|nr:hypothetical protein B0H19DRAFT_1056993 [Mycena capillaripes]
MKLEDSGKGGEVDNHIYGVMRECWKCSRSVNMLCAGFNSIAGHHQDGQRKPPAVVLNQMAICPTRLYSGPNVYKERSDESKNWGGRVRVVITESDEITGPLPKVGMGGEWSHREARACFNECWMRSRAWAMATWLVYREYEATWSSTTLRVIQEFQQGFIGDRPDLPVALMGMKRSVLGSDQLGWAVWCRTWNLEGILNQHQTANNLPPFTYIFCIQKPVEILALESVHSAKIINIQIIASTARTYTNWLRLLILNSFSKDQIMCCLPEEEAQARSKFATIYQSSADLLKTLVSSEGDEKHIAEGSFVKLTRLKRANLITACANLVRLLSNRPSPETDRSPWVVNQYFFLSIFVNFKAKIRAADSSSGFSDSAESSISTSFKPASQPTV